MKYYDKLIFEISKPGRIGYSLQQSDFGNYSLTDLPQSLRRETETDLPEASELDVVRHYTNVSNKNFGVETGFYPLGSCTMKYNPKINEEMALWNRSRHCTHYNPRIPYKGLYVFIMNWLMLYPRFQVWQNLH